MNLAMQRLLVYVFLTTLSLCPSSQAIALTCSDLLFGPYQFKKLRDSEPDSEDFSVEYAYLSTNTGKVVAMIEGERHTAKTVDLFHYTNSEFRRKGLSSALVERFFRDFKNFSQVRAYLTNDNHGIFMKHLKQNPEASLSDALRVTPFYKVLAKAGFTKIVEIDFYREGESIEVYISRPLD